MRLPIVYVDGQRRKTLISKTGVLRIIMIMRMFFGGDLWRDMNSSEVHKSHRLDCFNDQANPPSSLHRCDPSSRSLNGHADATTFFVKHHSNQTTAANPNKHSGTPRRFRQVPRHCQPPNIWTHPCGDKPQPLNRPAADLFSS